MRQAIVEIAGARKGGGKTKTTSEQKIAPYIVSTPTWKGRKVLIYDVNGEYTDRHLRDNLKVNWTAKTLALKDLQAWTKDGRIEVRRILPLNEQNQLTQDIRVMAEILETILKIFRNGMLLLEDINAYLINANTQHVVSAITRNRQKNLDIIIHYQSLRKIPPVVLSNMNIFRFHKINENVSTIEDKLNNPELFYIAQAIVNYKFKLNKWFYLYVNNEEDRIFGEFSKNDYRIGCYLYLLENKPDILRLAKNRFGNSDEAMKYCILELEKYYGN